MEICRVDCFCETVDNFVDKDLRLPDVGKKVRLTVMLGN